MTASERHRRRPTAKNSHHAGTGKAKPMNALHGNPADQEQPSGALTAGWWPLITSSTRVPVSWSSTKRIAAPDVSGRSRRRGRRTLGTCCRGA